MEVKHMKNLKKVLLDQISLLENEIKTDEDTELRLAKTKTIIEIAILLNSPNTFESITLDP